MPSPGKGVQIVTVNDYLAKRDAEWMGKVHEFLGLKSRGIKLHDAGGEKSSIPVRYHLCDEQ